MAIPRSSICGPPHIYLVQVQTALGLPRLAQPQASAILLDVLETIRGVFDAGIYAWMVREDSWAWIVRHRADMPEDESRLRKRWAQLGSRSIPRAAALRARLTSLSGLMQTVLGRASRRLSQQCGGPGTWWATRYRSCLLADDCAVLAAVHGLEHSNPADSSPIVDSSRQRHSTADVRPRLISLPCAEMPDGDIIPRDTATLGIMPPSPGNDQELFDRFCQQLPEESADEYLRASLQSWALGRPESLTDALSRLARGPGRGRSRRARELDDELGLCGVWG